MKIAIVKLSALGDIVHAMIVLQFIKKHNINIQVDWVVEENYKELLEFHPDINKLHIINIKKAKRKKSIVLVFNELKKVRKFGKYDLVIDMQGLIKSAIISRLIPSKFTFGFDKSSVRESLASIFYNKTFHYDYSKNVIERNFELIKFALELPFNKDEIQYKLPFLYSRSKYLVSSLSKQNHNIILIPGASRDSKRYPIEKFTELTKLMNANYLIIWGNEEERILAEKIKNLSPNVNICEKLSLDNLIYLVSRANLIIGSDTGPTHIGWALNIPSITLFGSTPGYRNTYETKINKIIESSSQVNASKIDKNDFSVGDINVKDIIDLSQRLLLNSES